VVHLTDYSVAVVASLNSPLMSYALASANISSPLATYQNAFGKNKHYFLNTIIVKCNQMLLESVFRLFFQIITKKGARIFLVLPDEGLCHKPWKQTASCVLAVRDQKHKTTLDTLYMCDVCGS
jgi:hypothetical protein